MNKLILNLPLIFLLIVDAMTTFHFKSLLKTTEFKEYETGVMTFAILFLITFCFILVLNIFYKSHVMFKCLIFVGVYSFILFVGNFGGVYSILNDFSYYLYYQILPLILFLMVMIFYLKSVKDPKSQ